MAWLYITRRRKRKEQDIGMIDFMRVIELLQEYLEDLTWGFYKKNLELENNNINNLIT